ncbi:MAG: Tyrosine-tRNA ligase [Berkelbacteria bacterium GW2011_GWA2_46_7]|uniref:Tyrosine--tRNA ligase n=1 Tax=Berkelbacteria bacterium GW2011_GWA2_46_7 TaxID=1618335 RepID=A0A0G1TGK7_9BACT|nr:MAG: Tyrosine-tRNA ligase [Berkelbacteria bacterium GW2011_GWA2_46_7]
MDSSRDLVLTWAVAEIINKASLVKRLESKKKLVVKFGVDPTKPDLHLGHALSLHKLRQFQELGHDTILLIGDFTTKIGDPSGRNSARPVLTDDEIQANLKTYIDQAKLIIDPKKTKIRFNSEWLSKVSYADFIKVAMQVSVQTLLEREDFANRMTSGHSLALHELFYPITQALDSVVMKADVEIGGWDQRLNMLMGRELQKKSGQPPQDVVAMKALVGTDGERKMSKSFDNYVGLTESSDQMFGKLMSIPDQLTDQYAELAAFLGSDEIKALPKHPRDRKARVAEKIVELYHGGSAANKALQNFNQTFRDKKVANHMASELLFSQESVLLLHAVAEASQCSNTHAGRLIEQGAVKLNGVKMMDPNFEIMLTGELMMHIGKHAFRKLGRRK